MKKAIILLVFLFMSNKMIGADAVIHFFGDCESSDTLQNYSTINYMRLHGMDLGSSTWTGPSMPDSIPFSTILAYMCETDSTQNENQGFRTFNERFYHITCGSNTYSLDPYVLDVILIYTALNNKDSIYVFELIDNQTGVPIAIDYGSDRSKTFSLGTNKLNFIVSLDNNNPYQDDYIGANLTFNVIYNYGNTYLFEITDDDRDDLLVGFKYKSPNLTNFYTKFIVPKP